MSATGPIFGTYTPLQATALSTTATVSTVCVVTSNKNTITIGLSSGQSGNFTARQMTTLVGGTTYTLNYNLFLDAADTQIWGDGTGGSLTDPVALKRHGNNSTIITNTTVYGAVAPGQDPAAGTYTDTIAVSVNF